MFGVFAVGVVPLVAATDVKGPKVE